MPAGRRSRSEIALRTRSAVNMMTARAKITMIAKPCSSATFKYPLSTANWPTLWCEVNRCVDWRFAVPRP
jgi:hypothetical protein